MTTKKKAAKPAAAKKQASPAKTSPAPAKGGTTEQKPKARTLRPGLAPEVKTTASGQKYVERKLINAPAQKTKGKK